MLTYKNNPGLQTQTNYYVKSWVKMYVIEMGIKMYMI